MSVQEQSVSKPNLMLSITRVIDAPAERVFDAWLDAGQIAQWLGPRMMVASAQTLVLEPRVGGRYRILMRMPPTETHRTDPVASGVYREIVRPSRLVFTWTWEDEGHETLVTILLKPVGSRTELTLLHENFAKPERRDSHNKGWAASLDQLSQLLSGDKAGVSMATQAVPDGYHTVTPYLLVRDAAKLIEFLKLAFGAAERHRTTLANGAIMHAEVQIGGSRVMMGQVPIGHEPMTAGLYMYVPDVDAVYASAIRAGAISISPPSDQFYGDRVGGVKDAAGNTWWIATHREDVPADEIARRSAEAAMKRVDPAA